MTDEERDMVARIEAACQEAEDDRAFDASQAADGERPDLWDPPEVTLPAALLRQAVSALRLRYEGEREMVARIVDPLAFADIEDLRAAALAAIAGNDLPERANRIAHREFGKLALRRELSLAKADAILQVLSTSSQDSLNTKDPS